MGFRGFALGAPERLGHSHEIVPFGFRDEARERQQLASLLASQAREMRAIGFDGTQHADASFDVVLGERALRVGIRIGGFHGAHCIPTCALEVSPGSAHGQRTVATAWI